MSILAPEPQRTTAAGPARHRRVVVSGAGAVCGLGWGIDAFWRGLRAGRTRVAAFDRFDHAGHRTHVAAQVPEPPGPIAASLARAFPRWARLSHADRFALFAAAEALAGAGLGSVLDGGSFDGRWFEGRWFEGEMAGVYFGSSTGGMFESEGFFAEVLERDRFGRLADLASQQVNGPGDAVARHLGVGGPVETVASACASGALALGAALEAVRSGEVEVAIAGGSDSLCRITYAGFNALRSVDESPCRPFRAGRAGLSIGEGAAALVLEPLERALERGVEPLAELAGAGAACDAHHMTAPHPEGAGAAAAIAAALADAGLDAEAVDFVNAHGTGTPLNDAAEWQALRRAFGERAGRLPVTATKGLVGHLLGSSGAIEAVATVLCLRHGEVHPTPADGALDPSIPVDLVVGGPRPLPGARAAVSTSLAFGGSNAALVFSPWRG